MKKNLMVGMGENAGVVDVGEGWAVTFKVESHNHPSYIEPFQGAATGVGGIVRDIISMGARPVAVMDQLRFGAIDDPDTARVVHGVVSRHLVLRQLPRPAEHRRRDLLRPGLPGQPARQRARRSACCATKTCTSPTRRGVGNKVVLFGARTGGDGIGGASILASDTFSAGGPTKRPAVQVGDPFAEKVLIECCLELFRDKLVEGIQDLGAAGISCATSELASQRRRRHVHRARQGAAARPDAHGRGDPHVGEPGAHDGGRQARRSSTRFLAVTAKWDVETSVLGEVTDTGRLVINWHGEEIVNVDPRTVAVDGPVYERPVAYPTWIDALQADSASRLAAPDRPATSCASSSSRSLGSAEPRRQGLDHRPVRLLRAAATPRSRFPDDAGMIRVDEE